MTTEEIKSAYSILDVLNKYGIRVDSHGFAKCPLHEGDNTPSFKIYPGTNTYHCFACGKSGDIFKFVQDYLHCDFKTAFIELGGEYVRPKTLREKREQAARLNEIERLKREKIRERNETEALMKNICLALTEIHRLLPKYEVFSEPWTNLTNEEVMLHDALMQLTERGNIKDGIFAAGVMRYS